MKFFLQFLLNIILSYGIKKRGTVNIRGEMFTLYFYFFNTSKTPLATNEREQTDVLKCV